MPPALLLVALLLSAACGGSSQEASGLVPDADLEITAKDVGVRFVDVTKESGLVFNHSTAVRTSILPEDLGSGLAWGDYDADGFVDLFAVNSSHDQDGAPAVDQGKLFHNRGDGTFEDATAASGIRQMGLGMGAIWFDHDADGSLDLFVTGFGFQQLYKNRGDGTFEDVTESIGLSMTEYWAMGVAAADYNMDGYVDLYVPHYVSFDIDRVQAEGKLDPQYHDLYYPFTLNPLSYTPQPNALYRNNGDGTFTDVTSQAGVANPEGRGFQAVFSDFDGDGLPDIFVANDASPDALFVNQGDGTYKDVAQYARTADSRYSMGVAVGDYDGDLDWDLWVTHWIAQDDALFRNMASDPEEEVVRFVDMIASAVGEASLRYVGWGVGFLDYDNDGWKDVFIANGSTFQDPKDVTQLERMPNLLFRNRQGESFALANDVAGEAWARENVARGAAQADYDNDGDIDIVILSRGEGLTLLENQGGNSRSWLTVELRGLAPNTQAVGATVVINAGGQKQAGAVSAGSSYLSMDDPRVHFGLGDQDIADWVEVRWPNGEVERLENVPANQVLRISQSGG